MDRSAKGPRTTQELSESFLSHLNAYALAAGAAGVSMMALAQPAEAEIVYTAANTSIPFNTNVSIDLNHDGNPDFGFFFYYFAYKGVFADVSVNPLNGGGVITGAGKYAAALFKGNSIGPARAFAGAEFMFRSQEDEYESSFYHRSVFGPWVNAQNRYLGVKFLVDGATHYGWIRLTGVTVAKDTRLKITVTGYAYETVADQPIQAGQLAEEANAAPAESAPLAKLSLGMLALGSQGLGLWRREEPSLSVQ